MESKAYNFHNSECCKQRQDFTSFWKLKRNKQTGLHKGAENRMTTDFLTSLEDGRHLKNAFKFLTEYYLQPQTNKQNKLFTKCEEKIKTL